MKKKITKQGLSKAGKGSKKGEGRMLFKKKNKSSLTSQKPKVWKSHQREVVAMVCVAFFLLVLFSLISHNPHDNTIFSFSTRTNQITNYVGVVGANVAAVLLYFLGSAVYALLAVLLMPAYVFFTQDEVTRQRVRMLWLPLLVITSAGLCNIYQCDITNSSCGGLIGKGIGLLLLPTVGYGGSLIVLWTCLWIGIVVAGRISVAALVIQFLQFKLKLGSYALQWLWQAVKDAIVGVKGKIINRWEERKQVQPARRSMEKDVAINKVFGEESEEDLDKPLVDEMLVRQEEQKVVSQGQPSAEDKDVLFWENVVSQSQTMSLQGSADGVKQENNGHPLLQEYSEKELQQVLQRVQRFSHKKIKNKGLGNTVFSKNIFAAGQGEDSPFHNLMKQVLQQRPGKETVMKGFYQLPELSMFIPSDEQTAHKLTQEAVERGKKLEEKLNHFGIKGKVTAVQPGPVITMYEYQPEIDSKLSKITALEDDLAMALSAMSIRIIAPIPGKNAVGFEIANKSRRGVLFSQAVISEQFQKTTCKLPIALGVDVVGQPVIHDLASMPHLLVGGTTGSGKSVGLNGIIASLLCRRTPEDMRLILVDPKRLEFTPYADIPHLLFPIVTNPTKATSILRWVTQEMEDRYERMALAAVRNIEEYQNLVKQGGKDKDGCPVDPMPYITVVIDELADLMIVAGKEIETYIVRIAQMARAAGIHMIVATQRPSVDVVTGLIKVNFPSRLAFRVSSKVDSRTIIDQQGAEKLLGKGDMLFMHSSSPHLMRIHGAYISDAEINGLTNHLRFQQAPVYLDLREVLRHDAEQAAGLEDELYPQIYDYVKTIDEISISSLQRKFNIGFNRSARIIEKLEQDGAIAPAQGSKPRKVLL